MADFTATQSLSSPSSSSSEDGDGFGVEPEPEPEPEEYESQEATPTSPFISPVLFPNPATTTTTGAGSRSGRRSNSRAAGILSPPPVASSERKPRGRPPGSKNKPKPPIYITKETEPALKTQVLEIPAGCDIVEMVQKFAIKHRVGVHIINGSGSVSNFTLRHPAITLSGSFNLLSLSGTFVGASISSSSSSSHPGSAPSLAIFVGGNAGEVFGGTVAGKVVAASSVLLNVNTFTDYEYHRVEPSEFEEVEEEEEVKPQEGNRGRQGGKQSTRSLPPAAAAAGGAAMVPVGFAIPAEHLNWAPSTAPTRSPHHHF